MTIIDDILTSFATLPERLARIQGDSTYRGYRITYDPPPIPTRDHDWHYCHDDYDGAPDSNDNRWGHACSLEEAKREIDMLIDEATP